MAFKVYISSVYSEFYQIRESIHQYISERAALYDLIGMENYGPEDRRVLDKCVEDVDHADIYLCILGYRYGTEAITTSADQPKISFTHWEFNTATEKKSEGKKIERLIYIKDSPGLNDDDPRLTGLKATIKGPQDILCRIFKEDADLPRLILKDLDNYISRTAGNSKSDDLVFTCNRSVPNLLFESKFNNDPIQFYLLHSHDRDMPHYFIKRKKLDFELKEKSLLLLDLQTNRIIEETPDFSVLEMLMNAAIFSKLPPGHGFLNADAITMPGLLRMLEKMNRNYLIITWNIQSIYWKNDIFCNHIKAFYENYNSYNKQFQTDRKIIFFGIAKYLDNSKLTEEEFDKRVVNITYGNHLPKLTKISVGEIKDWLVENWIEPNPDTAMSLIRQNFPDTSKTEFYYSEVEGVLKIMIEQFNNKN